MLQFCNIRKFGYNFLNVGFKVVWILPILSAIFCDVR
jgi:hypothetical protein